MRIGIDARLYGTKHTGIGRYVQNLVLNLAKIDKKNTYVVFGGEELKNDVKFFTNFRHVPLKTKIYSIAEQIINPVIFSRENLDLLHVPHFNAPIFYDGPMVITIHDLIKHLSTGKETTTLPSWQYQLKFQSYRVVTWLNVIRSNKVITPSNYWNQILQKTYHLPSDKIQTIYEAVDKKLIPTKKRPEEVLSKYALTKPFVIYTGNLYPHKNVPFLIESIDKFNQQHEHKIMLGLVSARSAFLEALPKSPSVKFLGFVPDKDLGSLYSQALALVQPSFIEGFGLTGLEAMQNRLLVISSNTTCLPEIYGDAALYFNPNKSEELIDCLEKAFRDHPLVESLRIKGLKRVKDFSWRKTAQETLKVYEEVLDHEQAA